MTEIVQRKKIGHKSKSMDSEIEENVSPTTEERRLLGEVVAASSDSDTAGVGENRIRLNSKKDEPDSGIDDSEEILFDKTLKDEDKRKPFSLKRLLKLSVEILLPFLMAGLGCVFAGWLLDRVEHWPQFEIMSELYILVPALLGLKGNLEMTLASRLSTAANLGLLDEKSRLFKIIIGNLALIQGQALIVGAAASGIALILDWIIDGNLCLLHIFVIPASALVTASLASAALSVLMVVVIVVSRHAQVNPDNIATPIAASLGDLVTLTILAYTSTGIYDTLKTSVTVPFVISGILLVVFLSLLPFWLYIAWKIKWTRNVVFSGLVPVFIAMAISSLGGLVLDVITKNFKGFALYSPVINGVGGNLVAVQASRISTSLHSTNLKLGEMPTSGKFTYNGFLGGFKCNTHGRVAHGLLLLSVIGSLLFLAVIALLGLGHTSQTAIFYFFYCLAAVSQVIILLLLAYYMVYSLWKRGQDPDNSAIPYLTALGDLLGTGLLAVAWLVLYYIGDRDNDVGH